MSAADDKKVKPLTLEELAAMPASELSKVRTKRRIAAALAGGKQSGGDRDDDDQGEDLPDRIGRFGRAVPDQDGVKRLTPIQRMSRADRSVPYAERED